MPAALTVGPAPARRSCAVGGGRQRGAREEGGGAAETGGVEAAGGGNPAGRDRLGGASRAVELRPARPGRELGGPGRIHRGGHAPRSGRGRRLRGRPFPPGGRDGPGRRPAAGLVLEQRLLGPVLPVADRARASRGARAAAGPRSRRAGGRVDRGRRAGGAVHLGRGGADRRHRRRGAGGRHRPVGAARGVRRRAAGLRRRSAGGQGSGGSDLPRPRGRRRGRGGWRRAVRGRSGRPHHAGAEREGRRAPARDGLRGAAGPATARSAGFRPGTQEEAARRSHVDPARAALERSGGSAAHGAHHRRAPAAAARWRAQGGEEGRPGERRGGLHAARRPEELHAAGEKVSRIASLADDLAMAMEALRVRIVAPIPGRGVVGIEVPNKERQMVVLRELAEQDAFQKSHSKLAMCLGKDIEGMPYIADLGKMPHLLIAGTTGSGKSVAVNAMIVSMLLRASPEEVRFLMVDPKMLELSVYEGIPHLLLPVVTDAKKAAMALRWGVEEMERRYQLLAECGVRNIASYNKKVEKEGDAARRAHKPAKEKKRVIDLTDPQLTLADALGASAELGAEPAASSGEPQAASPDPLRKLPYLVIIIDELADLMMVASREVETYIARLSQMARASGIHLMVATQRPSTDVVTGVIKANFPARISFQVASRHDSATIINTPGAEYLLGMGDMLILPPGTSTLTRVHGPYVDEKEIHAVVEHWKAQGAPVYDPNILRPRGDDADGAPVDDEGPHELYDQAVAALADMRFISISLLQRKLRVGYNRAARMIERMERDGIVGPADGAKPREVLIRPVGELPGAGA